MFLKSRLKIPVVFFFGICAHTTLLVVSFSQIFFLTFEPACVILFLLSFDPAQQSFQKSHSLYKMHLANIGMVWCVLVRCGANLGKECQTKVEFKTLFPIMKKHLADGGDIPYFFRELMAMITTVTEDEWGTGKDPSGKLSNETIRSYTKRKLSKKLASSIVYRLTPEVMVERINERSKTSRTLLADDLRGYDATLDADNVANAIAGWMVEIIQKSAGLVPQDALQQQQQQQLASDLKTRYGDYLLGETDGYCPFPGCGKQLTITGKGKAVHAYEVSLIDKSKPATPDNLIALCPHCYATYLLDDSKKLSKELNKIKNILSTHKQSVHLLDDLPLEKGIVGVIRKVKKLGEKELVGTSLNPKEIRQKLSPSQDTALFVAVNGYVTTYYPRIKEIMMNLDKRGEIDYDEIQDQIHAFYKRLKKTNRSRLEIFNEIAGKIHRVTLQDELYCQIVVSYFVQSCEVFDAITE